jgi:hypothetical protein
VRKLTKPLLVLLLPLLLLLLLLLLRCCAGQGWCVGWARFG